MGIFDKAFEINPFAKAGRIASEQAYAPTLQTSERAAQLSAFNMPYTTTGFGSAGMMNGQLQMQLSPEYLAQRNALLGQATGAFGALGSYDPDMAAQEQFARIEALMAPERAKQQAAQESRLYAQGRLGSTGGGVEQEALQGAFQQQQAANAIQSYMQAMQQQQHLQQMGLGALSAAGQLDQLPMGAFNAGLGYGQAQAGAGARQGAFLLEPRMAQSRMAGEGALGLTKDFTSFIGGMMGSMS